MRDLHNNIKTTPAINPAAAITGNAATNGATIDCQGFESCEFLVQSGNITDGAFALKIQEATQSNFGDGADAAQADVFGFGAAFAATDDNIIKTIGYRGSKRYCRVVATQSGATTGGFLSAAAVQSHARNQPATQGAAPSP